MGYVRPTGYYIQTARAAVEIRGYGTWPCWPHMTLGQAGPKRLFNSSRFSWISMFEQLSNCSQAAETKDAESAVCREIEEIQRSKEYALRQNCQTMLFRFVICRFVSQALFVQWAVSHMYKMHPFYVGIALGGPAVFLVINAMLFFRILVSDGFLDQRWKAKAAINRYGGGLEARTLIWFIRFIAFENSTEQMQGFKSAY